MMTTIFHDLIYGAHMSIAGGFAKAAQKAKTEYKTNAMQIFLKSPRGRKEKEISDAQALEFKNYHQQHGIAFIVAHCSYLLNFTQDVSQDSWPIESLVADLRNIHRLGGAGVVLHIGKYLELSREAAFDHLGKNIATILHQTEAQSNWLILENTAGQGTEIGWQLAEIEHIYKNVLKAHPRLRFCLDTAHIFAAGYDLREPQQVQTVMDEFDQRLGVKNLAMIHFNDSAKELGSRVDRHANLGQGLIGQKGLMAVMTWAAQHKIPLILETPEDDDGSHLPDLEILRSWMQGSQV